MKLLCVGGAADGQRFDVDVPNRATLVVNVPPPILPVVTPGMTLAELGEFRYTQFTYRVMRLPECPGGIPYLSASGDVFVDM